MGTNLFWVIGLFVSLSFILQFNSKPARADVQSLDIQETEHKVFGAQECIVVSGRMNGEAPGGDYSVAFTMMYPRDVSLRNGMAVVDVANSTLQTFTFLDTFQSDHPEFFPVQYIGKILMGESFLCRHGYVYASVAWDKGGMGICEAFGQSWCTGEMALDSDGYWVVRDAGAFLKSQHPHLTALLGEPPDAAAAFGYSLSSYLLQQIYKRMAMDMSYDGVLLGGTDYSCTTLTDGVGWNFETGCEGMMPESAGKSIVINTETDVQTGGWLIRAENAWNRVYEMAGTPHIPFRIGDMTAYGATRQNPADISAAVRGAMENLRAWIMEGKEPPPSAFLNLTGNYTEYDLFPFLGLGLVPVFELEREDGCATGGVRLPHCPTTDGAKRYGAPLGDYEGVETDLHFDPENDLLFRASIVSYGGTFDPASLGDLQARYPNRGAYVSKLSRAAGAAASHRWILAEDVEAYSRSAAHCGVGHKSFLPPTDEELRAALEACHEL